MRPTLLNFRSPKEKTPFYFDPKNTYDGRVLSFSSPKGSGKTSTFSNEKRFTWYKKIQGSTYGIGPGSYSPMGLRNGKERITSGSPYRQLHAIKDYANEHLMVGDQIVVNNDFSASGKERSGFGSEHKFSTKQSSLDFKRSSKQQSRKNAGRSLPKYRDHKGLLQTIDKKYQSVPITILMPVC